eukprot:4338238-Pyramimonas_sp.AAC.1
MYPARRRRERKLLRVWCPPRRRVFIGTFWREHLPYGALGRRPLDARNSRAGAPAWAAAHHRQLHRVDLRSDWRLGGVDLAVQRRVLVLEGLQADGVVRWAPLNSIRTPANIGLQVVGVAVGIRQRERLVLAQRDTRCMGVAGTSCLRDAKADHGGRHVEQLGLH